MAKIMGPKDRDVIFTFEEEICCCFFVASRKKSSLSQETNLDKQVYVSSNRVLLEVNYKDVVLNKEGAIKESINNIIQAVQTLSNKYDKDSKEIVAEMKRTVTKIASGNEPLTIGDIVCVNEIMIRRFIKQEGI